MTLDQSVQSLNELDEIEINSQPIEEVEPPKLVIEETPTVKPVDAAKPGIQREPKPIKKKDGCCVVF